MQRIPFILILGLLIAGCSLVPVPGSVTDPIELPNIGRAPELSNEVWINVDQPLRLADLRGQVVLLDMWTFG